jgi:hypothetical protein
MLLRGSDRGFRAVHARLRSFVCVCVRVCDYACVHACARARVRVRACACAYVRRARACDLGERAMRAFACEHVCVRVRVSVCAGRYARPPPAPTPTPSPSPSVVTAAEIVEEFRGWSTRLTAFVAQQLWNAATQSFATLSQPLAAPPSAAAATSGVGGVGRRGRKEEEKEVARSSIGTLGVGSGSDYVAIAEEEGARTLQQCPPAWPANATVTVRELIGRVVAIFPRSLEVGSQLFVCWSRMTCLLFRK